MTDAALRYRIREEGPWQVLHARMSAHGIIVLHYPPARVKSQPRIVAAEIRSALEAGRGRQLPLLRTLPAR